MRTKAILLLYVMLLAQYIHAQSVLRYQHIGIADGLSQSTVNSIYQDSHGFIWLATGDGLNRYDGKHFIAYKSSINDTFVSSIKDRNINSRIYEDGNNKLWFASDAGVSFLDTRTGKFTLVVDKYTTACAALLAGIDSAGLWLVVPHKGITLIDTRTLKTTHYPFCDPFQNSSKIFAINNAAATTDKLWIVDKRGLICFDKYTKKDTRVFINNDIACVSVLQDGRLLLGTGNGIYLRSATNDSSKFVAIRDKADILWSDCAQNTKTGFVYLSAEAGGTIARLDPSKLTYDLLNFQNNKVTNLFIDRSENLWVGTDGNGAYRMNITQPKFFCFGPKTLYDESENDKHFIKSIYRDEDGKLWLGTFNSGLMLLDTRTGRQENIPVAHDNNGRLISVVTKDSSGNILVTVDNSVLLLDKASHKVIRKYSLPPSSSMQDIVQAIFSILEWKKGHYIVASNQGLLSAAVQQNSSSLNLHSLFLADTFLLGTPYNLYRKDGFIYIGQRIGFVKIRMLTDTTVQVADHGFRDMPIRHFYKCDDRPIVWMASEQGLIAYNETTKKHRLFDERNGLANSFIYAILADGDTSLWVSTNNGIANVRVSYSNKDMPMVTRVKNYGIQDGLQSAEFNTGAHFTDNKGWFYFGGIAGVNWFDPRSMAAQQSAATPAISAIMVNDSLYAGDTALYVRSMTLPYDRNTISFSLSTLEFSGGTENRFTYKMEGVDKDWVQTASDIARYANLAPGSYTFLLRGSNELPLQITITITPPWWQTWWFYTLLAVTIAAITYFTARYYVRLRIKARTRQLERQQAIYVERLRISKDVHDDLGSGLSKISLMADIAQRKANDNVAAAGEIEHISAVSRELVDNMRDLVWVLNPENTTLEQLVVRIREYCADYLDNMPLDVALDFPHDVPDVRISREAQRNIFLTVKEAVNNCIKHAGASGIRIAASCCDDKLQVFISDNGRGFAAGSYKGNGLKNMRCRIESIGGSFDITSVPGSTTIRFTVDQDKLTTQDNTLM